MSQEKPESASPSLVSRARKALSGVETGPSVIARHARTAPGGPGVYRMIDADGEVLYVGKARGLKKRVQSYARAGSHNNRITAMIANTATMEFVTTPTETEALLLEANLIKRLKPRYNVVLRDDKSFPFILIARDHAFPQILKHRGARSRKGDYFGPFASAGAVGRTINTLQRAFLLRSCSDAYFETRLRPCLLYQIKRCSAPCTAEISEADYAALIDEASLRQDYECAASFRDRLTALSNVQSHQGINPQNVKVADVFAAHQDAGQTAIQVFFFRTGNNWGNRAYFPRADKSLPVEEVLESFVAQFYDDKPPPKLVLLSDDIAGRRLLGEALSLRAVIVASLEGFIRNQYRKFNIRSEDLAPGDDYAMMREMLTRRFSKLARDKDPANGWAAPDLVLIDGGPGQLSAAFSVLDELGLSEIKLAAIAKGPDRNAGRERIYLEGREPLLLEPRDPVLYCIQKLRDEAHRFAVGAHRARRKKAMQTSPLDEIQGIGPSRKRALLQHFGSAKAVSRAGIADLAAVGGISAQMAKTIYDHFHERG